VHRTAALVLLFAALFAWATGWAQAEPAKPAENWKVAYKADFKESKPGQEWVVLAGEATCSNGALVLAATAEGDGHIVLTNADCSGSVKMEFNGVLTGENPCDMSPVLNCGPDGHGSGYLLQFGGANNTKDRLRVARKIVKTNNRTNPKIEPGKKHHIVATSDGGKVTLEVDGKVVFKYTDAQPLEGAMHSMVGFYTHGCTLTITDLVVSKHD
jgi:hypothetical protein